MDEVTKRQQEAWEACQEARKLAHETNNIKDGIAAGRAWSAFVNAFALPDNVVPFPRVPQ